MTSHDDESGLFLAALTIVAMVVCFFVAKRMFGEPRSSRHRLWIFVLVSLSPASTTVHAPRHWHSEGRAGWSAPYMPAPTHIARHLFQIA